MAKAQIILPNGTKINMEGTPEEIIFVQKALSVNPQGVISKSKVKSFLGKAPNKKASKKGPMDRIRNLISEEFFKEKRTMNDVKKILEQKAIFYKTSDLAPTLIRLIKNGELRRLKENNKWVYVNS